jgi:hypothetical protein
MEVVNPTHMVKNAWGFADQMMEYRNWVDDDEQPKSAPDATIEATSPSEEGPD